MVSSVHGLINRAGISKQLSGAGDIFSTPFLAGLPTTPRKWRDLVPL